MRGVLAALRLVAAAAIAGLVAGQDSSNGSGALEGSTDSLCFNQLQVLGTHNSYHQAPPQDLLAQFGGLTAGPLLAWQYSHPSLTQQLEAGVRAFELDVYWDPQGGTFGQSAGLRIAGQNGWLTDPKYQQPGFKVLHIPDFDFCTSCILLTDCLAEIKQWSDANPRHLPIQIYFEVKGAGQLSEELGGLLSGLLQTMLDGSSAQGPTGFIQEPIPTAQTFLDLQAELLAAFGQGGGQLLTPDAVRQAAGIGAGGDLQQLLLKAPGSGPCPWPALDSMRGKVLAALIMQGGSSLAASFQQAYPDLTGSLAWVAQDTRSPLPNAVFRAAAIGRLISGNSLSLDLPANASDMVASLAGYVREAVQAGHIVRARADADTVEARAGYTGRRDAMLAAGAQVVASDFILPAGQQRAADSASQALYSTTYSVALPGGLPGRCLTYTSSSNGTSSGNAPGMAAESMPAAATTGDGIYCGPLLSAEGAAGNDTPQALTGAEGSSGGSNSSGVAPLLPYTTAPSPASQLQQEASPPQQQQTKQGAKNGNAQQAPVAASVAAAACLLAAMLLAL